MKPQSLPHTCHESFPSMWEKPQFLILDEIIWNSNLEGFYVLRYLIIDYDRKPIFIIGVGGHHF
jgi:hypothetical protein